MSEHRDRERDKRPWYRKGLHFQCQPGCANCCGGDPGDVWVDDKEKAAIAAFMQLAVKTFNSTYVRKVADGDSLREKRNGDCILLRADGSGCSVYSARPRQCRTFPFWPENVISRRAWEGLKRECPGIGKGRLWTAAEIERMLAETDELVMHV